jgi:hypothetical protein
VSNSGRYSSVEFKVLNFSLRLDITLSSSIIKRSSLVRFQ